MTGRITEELRGYINSVPTSSAFKRKIAAIADRIDAAYDLAADGVQGTGSRTRSDATGLARLHMSDGSKLLIRMADFMNKMYRNSSGCNFAIVRLHGDNKVAIVNCSQIAWVDRVEE